MEHPCVLQITGGTGDPFGGFYAQAEVFCCLPHRVYAKMTLAVFSASDASRDVAQLGRALRSGRRGRRFESCHPDHFHAHFLFHSRRAAFVSRACVFSSGSFPSSRKMPIHSRTVPLQRARFLHVLQLHALFEGFRLLAAWQSKVISLGLQPLGTGAGAKPGRLCLA